MGDQDGFNEGLVKRVIESSTFWKDVVFLSRVGSTNDVAKDLASEGAPAGTVVIADEQTAGRGRLDRRWIAPPGTSLLCSILFRPDLRPAEAHLLTMLCSLAAADAIERVAALEVSLKWPNDLVVEPDTSEPSVSRWRKLAGILTESGLTGDRLAFVVVGIGINVNVPADRLPDLAPDATSILAETGNELSRWELLVALLQAAAARRARLEEGQSPHGEWSARLATLGRRVRAVTSEGVFVGVAETVDEDGALLLRTDDGALRRLLMGDVTLAQT